MSKQSQRAIVLAPPHDAVEPAYSDDRTTIPVFLGCDDNFLPHALTVIASVMAHASPSNNYDLFIVQSGIPRERMDAAADWMKRYPNATLRFIDIDPCLEGFRGTLTVTSQFSVAAFFRVFASTLFSKYARIAYLDSDIVALGDVADFYRLDLDGMEVGAICDLAATSESRRDSALAEFWRTQLGKRPGEDYFFSGGLVMDLELMRREDTQRKLLARAGEIKDSRLPDQDVLNAVLNGKIKSLPCAWNCLDWMCDEEEEAPNFLLLREDFMRTLREARRSVKVVHFAEKKPWTMEYRGKLADAYWRYAAETPFYSQSLERIRRDCAPIRLLRLRVTTRFQEAHISVKLLIASGRKKEKCLHRLRNLRWRRIGLARQTEFVRKLLAKDGNV